MFRIVSAVTAAFLLITGYVAVVPHDDASSAPPGPHEHIPVLPASEPVTPPLPRDGWTVSASDEEISGGSGGAANVLDGNPATFWHTKGSASAAPVPHTLTIDTKVTQNISGLRYLPRPDVENGRIGSFEITVSTNGTTWGTPVAHGTWADSAAEKSVTFAPVTARYVRLKATAEAGNRGSWSSAAEINLIGQSDGGRMTTLAVNGAQGSWGPTINFPIVPVAAALLPGNKLMAWSSYSATTFGGTNGYTQTSILNLGTGAVTRTAVANTAHDMFCPGTSMLPDGRIMVSGGSNSTKTSLYDPAANTWTRGPAMTMGRGYQSNVTTSTGEVLTLGGAWSGQVGNKHGELWSAAGGWRALPNVLSDNILTDDPDGEFRSDNHAWLFAAPGGRVFHAGPSRQMNWISTTGAGSITSAGLRSDSADAMNGDAVMYDIGKILTVGGATAYSGVAATARAYTIDINNGATAARTADMAVSRSFANGVALPDGKVLVVGGQATPVPWTDTNARMAPEIWNPATGLWTTMAPMAIPRTYHSVALLLPDARVFVGGGGLCEGDCNTNHLDGEIFTPPYLLNADGSARVRPRIVASPTFATPGSTIAVTTGAPTTKFSLMRMSTVTHTVNTDQRRIPLTATAVSGNTASLRLPSDRGVLVPGNYMLFALDANGVPSVASTINIGTTPPAPSGPSIASAADTVAAGADGVLWNYRATGAGGIQPRHMIGSGWAGLAKGYVIDWNSDGVYDIVAQWKDGRLNYYLGKHSGGFAPAQSLGGGWGSYHVTVGRWRTADKYPGILAYDAAGSLWYYGNGTGKTLSPRTYRGGGWRGLYLTMADFDQNGTQDLLAKRSDGNLLLYRSNGTGGFVNQTRPVVGTGWNSINSITNVAGFTPGSNGLIARLTDGRLAHYPYSKGTWGTRTFISGGWGPYNIFR
jgi:galactose oxidase